MTTEPDRPPNRTITLPHRLLSGHAPPNATLVAVGLVGLAHENGAINAVNEAFVIALLGRVTNLDDGAVLYGMGFLEGAGLVRVVRGDKSISLTLTWVGVPDDQRNGRERGESSRATSTHRPADRLTEARPPFSNGTLPAGVESGDGDPFRVFPEIFPAGPVSSEYKIAVALASLADGRGVVTAARPEVMRAAGVQRRACQTAMRWLEAKGLIALGPDERGRSRRRVTILWGAKPGGQGGEP